MKILEKFVELLYPKGLTCNGCGKELFDDERKYSLCKKCAAKIFEPGQKYLGEDSARLLEGNCVARGCFRYDGLVRDYVIDYKDDDKTYLCYYMALHMSELYERQPFRADCIVYVPVGEKGYKKRGYDGMKFIAEEFSKATGLPIRAVLVHADGTDQSKVAPEKRAENVRGKFSCSEKIGGKVLLLDDVVTTGATAEACVSALKNAGAEEVQVLTFAVAGE